MRLRSAAKNLYGTIAIKFLTVLTLFVLALAQPVTVSATLKFKVVENQLIVTGHIESGDAWYFKREIDKHPEVDTVVLRNMPGGRIVDMDNITAMVEDKKFNTIVSGSCSSACAHIFLAGERRQFSDDFPLIYSRLRYHGSYRGGGSLKGIATPIPANFELWYVKRTEGKLPAELVLEWTNFYSSSGFAIFYHPKVNFPTAFGVKLTRSFMCDGRMLLKKCKFLTKTVLDYSIITTDELAHVKDTPFWNPGLYKQTDIPVSALLDGTVLNSKLISHVTSYLSKPLQRNYVGYEFPGKAMVISQNGRWLFWKSRLDLRAAIAHAIDTCEERSKGKCHVIAVDDKLIYTPKKIENLDFKIN